MTPAGAVEKEIYSTLKESESFQVLQDIRLFFFEENSINMEGNESGFAKKGNDQNPMNVNREGRGGLITKRN